jgi:hypothetical protein
MKLQQINTKIGDWGIEFEESERCDRSIPPASDNVG